MIIKKIIIILGVLIEVIINNADAGFWSTSVILPVSGSSTVRDDGFDIVFGSSTTELSSFRDSWTTFGTATFWIKTTLAPGNNSYYVYYNNSTATDASTFSTVFTKNYEESGLIGSWHLDEGIGTITYDVSNNANTGTFVGTNIWQTSDGGHWNGSEVTKFNTGSHLKFDGSGGYVNCGNAPSLNITGIFSISLWVNIISFPITSIWVNKGYKFFIFSDSSTTWRPEFRINNTTPFCIGLTRLDLNFNKWFHIVGTYDGTTMRLYVNNILEGTALHGAPTTTTEPFTIAKAGEVTNGYIDEVRVYNRVLSPAEIQTLYERRKYNEGTITVTYGAEEQNPGTIYPAYTLRRPITINNPGTTTLTNFQTKIPLRIISGGIKIKD